MPIEANPWDLAQVTETWDVVSDYGLHGERYRAGSCPICGICWLLSDRKQSRCSWSRGVK